MGEEGYARDAEVHDGARGVRRRAGVMHGQRNAQSSGARALGAVQKTNLENNLTRGGLAEILSQVQ